MDPTALARHAQEALMLTVAISLPVVAIAATIGMIVAAFQAASQIQDPTLAHLPRFIAVAIALAILGPWMGSEMRGFAEKMMLVALR